MLRLRWDIFLQLLRTTRMHGKGTIRWPGEISLYVQLGTAISSMKHTTVDLVNGREARCHFSNRMPLMPMHDGHKSAHKLWFTEEIMLLCVLPTR